MDHPVLPDYYSQQSGNPFEALENPNRYVREMTDEFWRAQRTRVMDSANMPDFAYLPAPQDPDVAVAGVSLNVPDALGDISRHWSYS